MLFQPVKYEPEEHQMVPRAERNQGPLTIREFPFASWWGGVVALGIGAFFSSNDINSLAYLIYGIGVYIFLRSTVMTIHIDKEKDLLSISYWAPLKRKKYKFSVGDVAAVDIEQFASRSMGYISVTGRLTVELTDRKIVPLRSYHHGDLKELRRIKEAVNSYLGIEQEQQEEINKRPRRVRWEQLYLA